MRYSEDLRRRVVRHVQGGGSRAEASRRYGVSVWCVYDWLRRGEQLEPGKPGPKRSYKLDWGKLQEVLRSKQDATLEELGREFGVSYNAVWYALRRLKISRKKRVGVTRKHRDMRRGEESI